jgi:hypothetical protein
LGATVASLPVAFGMARSGMNKIAAGLNEKVASARTAATESRATDFIRDTEAARSLARTAPLKSGAVVAASGMFPAEVQMVPDLLDYKTMPRDSRAFKEAQDTFKDPMTYVKNLAVPAIGGLVSAGTGFAKSDMLKNSGMADAKALAGSLKGMDKKLDTEGKAQEWATRSAKAKDAETALVEANLRNAEARAKTPAEAAKPPATPKMTAEEVAEKLKGLGPPKAKFIPGTPGPKPDHGDVYALMKREDVRKRLAEHVAHKNRDTLTGPDVIKALKDLFPDMPDKAAQASRLARRMRNSKDFMDKEVPEARKALGKERSGREGKAALKAMRQTKED